MDGEDGGVAESLMVPLGEPWAGGDVEGTARLTATPSSASPAGETQTQRHRTGLETHNGSGAPSRPARSPLLAKTDSGDCIFQLCNIHMVALLPLFCST